MSARAFILAATALWLSFATCAFAQKSGPLKDEDYEGYATYFRGTYAVIGRLPKSGKPYTGKVVLVANGKEFKVMRTIARETTEGRAVVDVDPVGRHILVMEFTQGGRRYEGTYMFMNNFNNYPRLAGRVNRPGHSRDWSPADGLEALFPGDDPACGFGS